MPFHEDGPTPEEKQAHETLLAIYEDAERFGEMTLQELKNLLTNSGLVELPADQTQTHQTEYWYFITKDGAICHLAFTAYYGYTLDIYVEDVVINPDISYFHELDESSREQLRKIYEISEQVQLNITAVFERYLEDLMKSWPLETDDESTESDE